MRPSISSPQLLTSSAPQPLSPSAPLACPALSFLPPQLLSPSATRRLSYHFQQPHSISLSNPSALEVLLPSCSKVPHQPSSQAPWLLSAFNLTIWALLAPHFLIGSAPPHPRCPTLAFTPTERTGKLRALASVLTQNPAPSAQHFISISQF